MEVIPSQDVAAKIRTRSLVRKEIEIVFQATVKKTNSLAGCDRWYRQLAKNNLHKTNSYL